MQLALDLLIKNPLLLLFLVAAVGYPLGKLRLAGGSLGVASVLFVGLGFGALHPELKLPELLSLFGLTLFVYTIGLSSGPSFFGSFRKKGLPETLLVVGVLIFATGVAIIFKKWLGLESETVAGLFAGGLNNTPALASVLDQLKATTHATEEVLSRPVIAYSISYPLGVLGTILAIGFAQRFWKVDYLKEAQMAAAAGDVASGETIRNRTVLITKPAMLRLSASELSQGQCQGILFGRVKRGEKQWLVTPEMHFELLDEIVIIGPSRALDTAMSVLGSRADEDLTSDRSEYDYKRVFLSNHKLVGKKVGELSELAQMDAAITRVNRGDVALLAHPNFVLEPGDRVRVICRKERMEDVCRFFGDSYRAVSEIDVLSFSIGLVMGTLLGLIPVPLGNDIVFRLGFAGGPLVMGLILGKVHRTGPVVWVLPYGATMMLRQLGLVLFLATVGTRAGYNFFHTLLHGDGWKIFLVGAGVTFSSVLALLVVGFKGFRIPMGRLIGMVAGIQTQPAVLGFALEQTRNEIPNAGYAMVHPLATITKILFAQFLLTI